MIQASLQQKLTLGAGAAAAALGVAIPVSVAATTALMVIAVALALAAGLYARHWRALLGHPVVLIGLLLFAWLAMSLAYTAAPHAEALRVLKKYRELLLLPLLMPLLLDPAVRRWAMRGFIAAMLLTLLVSYVMALWQWWEHGRLVEDPEVFKHRITQSTLLAFTAYWAWLQAWRDEGRRRLWLAVVVLIAFNVFVLLSGRSGQLIFLALAALALFQRYRWKGFVLTGLLGVLLLGGAFLTSDLFRDRVSETVEALAQFEQRQIGRNSTAVRLSYYPVSLALIGERPLLGHGVGSIERVYREQVEGTPFPPTINPHNEFLTLGIQGGIPAILLLAAWFGSQWWWARRLPPPRRRLFEGVLVTMVVGCLFNSFLLDSTEAHWFVYFVALLLYDEANA